MIIGFYGGGNASTGNIVGGNVGVIGNVSNCLNGAGGPKGVGGYNINGGGVIKSVQKQMVNVVKDEKKEMK